MVECLSHSKSGNKICSFEELNRVFLDKISGKVSIEQEEGIARIICKQLSTSELLLKYNLQSQRFYL